MRVSVEGTSGTKPWANIFWLQLTVSSAPSQADIDAVVTAVGAAYKTAFQANQKNDTTYLQARGTFFAPGGGVLLSTATMTGVGTNGVDANFPPSVCAVLSWLSTVYWRGGKPRTYLPGLREGNLTTAYSLTAGVITALNTAGATFRTAINAIASGAVTATSFGFVSFRTLNAERGTPLFFAITGVRVHARVGSQRHRLGRPLP